MVDMDMVDMDMVDMDMDMVDMDMVDMMDMDPGPGSHHFCQRVMLSLKKLVMRRKRHILDLLGAENSQEESEELGSEVLG